MRSLPAIHLFVAFSTPRARISQRAPDGEHTPGCAAGAAVGPDRVGSPGKESAAANDGCSSGARVFSRRRGPATRALRGCGCAPTYLLLLSYIAPSGDGTRGPSGSASTV